MVTNHFVLPGMQSSVRYTEGNLHVCAAQVLQLIVPFQYMKQDVSYYFVYLYVTSWYSSKPRISIITHRHSPSESPSTPFRFQHRESNKPKAYYYSEVCP